MVKLDERIVLWAVMTNTTPIGAIIDRLAKTRQDRAELEIEELDHYLGLLIDRGLVIRSYSGGLVLYRKVPNAMRALERELTA